MASIEKLARAFEALKVFQPAEKDDAKTVLPVPRKKEVILTTKDKIGHLSTISDCICSNSLRNVVDFPKYLSIAIETFLFHCCDNEADIRLKADECLNRTVKVLLENNASRIQVELYKEIKKNGPARSLRAALWRFADMCHLIRPQRCRPYVVNLLPCLTKICRRPEEPVQETLAVAMAKICPVLMPFTNNTETKILMKAFTPNLKSTSATIRRTAASCLSLIAQHSRKPATFYAFLLSLLLEVALPVETNKPPAHWVGVLLTLRHIVAYLGGPQSDVDTSAREDVGGPKIKDFQMEVTKEQLIQVYELLLYLVNHSDSTVVTAALETLHQLLRSPPVLLLPVLTTVGSITRTSIYERDLVALHQQLKSAESSRKPSAAEDGEEQEEDFGAAPDNRSTASSSSSEDLSQFIGELDGSALVGDEVTALSGGSTRDAMEMKHTYSADQLAAQGGLNTSEMYVNMDIGYPGDEPKTPMSPLSQSDTASDAGSRGGLPEPSATADSSNDEVVSTEELLARGASLDIPSGGSSSGRGAVAVWEGDIGSVTDGDASPLVFCVRLLASKFLLTGHVNGILPDSMARVSLKSLALNCIACCAALSPDTLLLRLHKDEGRAQMLSDVFLVSTHADPQLRGVCATLVGCQLHAQLARDAGCLWSETDATSGLSTKDLLDRIVVLLADSSPLTVRLALVALRSCVHLLLNSVHASLALRALLVALEHVGNSYWLVKVELLELISELDFRIIAYTVSNCRTLSAGDHHFCGEVDVQQRVCTDVILPLLADEDAKVRHCAASVLVRIVPYLYYPPEDALLDAVVVTARDRVQGLLDPVLSEWYQCPPPFLHGLVSPYSFDPTQATPYDLERNLSHIVSMVTDNLASSPSKHYTSGCCEALALLLDAYPSVVYPSAWFGATSNRQSKSKKSDTTVFNKLADSAAAMLGPSSAMPPASEDVGGGSNCGALAVLVSMLTSSALTLDLVVHQHTLTAASLLFAGAAVKSLRNVPDVSLDSPLWVSIGNRLLVPLAEQLFTHILRLLNMFSQVIEEHQASTQPQPLISKPTLPSLPNAPLLSPIRKKSKDVAPSGGKDGQSGNQPPLDAAKDGEKEKSRKEAQGSVQGLLHYQKLQDIIRMAYTTYQISLDLSNQDRFCSLLRCTLEALCTVLEVTCLPKAVRCVDEVLGYLGSTINIESTISVMCVQQLLKALFGTNLASQWPLGSVYGEGGGRIARLTSGQRQGLYHCCFTAPYTQFTQSLASASFRNTPHIENEDTMSVISWLKRRAERRVPVMLRPNSKVDKATVGSYIRLFESLVIKSLKLYNTSSLALQEQVLDLLTQLLLLRVNYNLLDADQVFITYVMRQFEFIEEGQVASPQRLIAAIFNFLIMLSYEKYNSRTIVATPKIIQLCEGIMASGQDPVTHVISALQPIVNDLLVVRGGVNKGEGGKDLDTQREVIVAMLFKLLPYHEVLDLLIVVLHQTHKEAEDKWRKLSRQIIDQLLPLLDTQQVNLDNQRSLDVVHRLFESVSSSVFRPVDIVLKTLFIDSSSVVTVSGVQRWLCAVLCVLRVLIMQAKEDTVLSRLQELDMDVVIRTIAIGKLQHAHQTNGGQVTRVTTTVSSGSVEEKFARFLLQTIGVIATEISSMRTSSERYSSRSTPCFLSQQLSHLFLYIIHMFQSGLYKRTCAAAVGIGRQESAPEHLMTMADINAAMLCVGGGEPTVLLQWCNLLVLLNYTHRPWWSTILRHSASLQPAKSSSSDGAIPECSWPCNVDVVKRGAVILYCDYACDNLNDLEPMSWLIDRHVYELVTMAREPPVQDFITAVQRSAVVSFLFLDALSSKCAQALLVPAFMRRVLQCVKDVHVNASGALLLFIVDKFLATHHVAVARQAETIMCRRLETLLALSPEECAIHMPAESARRLQRNVVLLPVAHRFARLSTFLKRLCTHLSVDVHSAPVPKRQHPLAQALSNLGDDILADYKLNKEWFSSLVASLCCSANPDAAVCAQLLQHLDYCSILNILMASDCDASLFPACTALGLRRTLKACEEARSTYSSLVAAAASAVGSGPRSQEDLLDPLLQAAQITLCRHINVVTNSLPLPHRLIDFDVDDAALKTASLSAEDKLYREKLMELLGDSGWRRNVLALMGGLRSYIACLSVLPWKPGVPYESTRDLVRFCVLGLEVCHWLLVHDQSLSANQLEDCIGCLAAELQRPELQDVIGQNEQSSWLYSALRSLRQIVLSYVVEPGNRLAAAPKKKRPHDSDDTDHPKEPTLSVAAQACVSIHELVHYAYKHLVDVSCTVSVTGIKGQHLPVTLQRLLRNAIIGLAQLPLLNGFARTPRDVWPENWALGKERPQVNAMSLEQLQEKDVLQDFVCCINLIGWSSRQQFEETWMYLLGVISLLLQPPEEHGGGKEEIENCHCAMVAVRGVTALLLDTLRVPQAGNPANSRHGYASRNKPVAFLQTRAGKKLSVLRVALQQYEETALKQRMGHAPESLMDVTGDGVDITKTLFVSNAEWLCHDGEHYMGQFSSDSLWTALNVNPIGSVQSRDLSPARDDVTTQQPFVATSYMGVRRTPAVLDITSCLQLLLEVYGQLLSVSAMPPVQPPLALYCEIVRSAVMVSDVFTQRAHFEWLFSTLMHVYKVHPIEDEFVAESVVYGVCKAAAIAGLDSVTSEPVIRIIEASLRSPHLPVKIAAFEGCLHLLEAGPTEVSRQLMPLLLEVLLRTLTPWTPSAVYSDQLFLAMLAVAFFLLEHFHIDVIPAGLDLRLVQVVTLVLAAPEEMTSVAVFVSLVHGMERLVLCDRLTRQDVSALVKASTARLQASNSVRSIVALGLLLTCIYSGKHIDSGVRSTDMDLASADSSHLLPELPSDPDTMVTILEKITVLFERMRRGLPGEARLLASIVPQLLVDLCPPQDIMNKVIGEFLSNQQPHPTIMARVVFEVFGHQLRCHQHALVHDWLLLSLSNFTQRTPFSLALWSQTVFFVSASTTSWLRASFPYVLSRLGYAETEDVRLFYLAAIDFYSQLQSADLRRTFRSVYQSVGEHDEAVYTRFCSLCAALDAPSS